jgi:hypothetical protein
LQFRQRFGTDEKTRLTIGAINVFDRAPPAAAFTVSAELNVSIQRLDCAN